MFLLLSSTDNWLVSFLSLGNMVDTDMLFNMVVEHLIINVHVLCWYHFGVVRLMSMSGLPLSNTSSQQMR